MRPLIKPQIIFFFIIVVAAIIFIIIINIICGIVVASKVLKTCIVAAHTCWIPEETISMCLKPALRSATRTEGGSKSIRREILLETLNGSFVIVVLLSFGASHAGS